MPDVSPAYLGVGYIIGPRLAALNFAGGVLAWGLLVPLLTHVLGPSLQADASGHAGVMAATGEFDLLLHCPADRSRRNAGGRVIHPVPDAEAAWPRHLTRGPRFEAIGGRP